MDVKTTGPDPERDRIVALVVMRVVLAEFVKGLSPPSHEVWVDRTRARFNPGRPTSKSATRLHGTEDAHVEDAELFADAAQTFRAFIGDLPVVGHDVAAAVAFLDREFILAGVDSLDANEKYCTKRRFCGDQETVANSSLSEMDTALHLRRHVRSFPVDAEDRDAARTLLAAAHFWAADNGHRLAKRRFISDGTIETLVAVLAGVGGVGLLVKVFLPPVLVIVAVLALMYYISPGLTVAFGLFGVACTWFMWWVYSRAKELEDEGDSSE